MVAATQPTPAASCRWHSLAAQLNDPNVELTIENFAPIMATYTHLRHAGIKFDAMLDALMATLNRQAFDTPDDSDQDAEGMDERENDLLKEW